MNRNPSLSLVKQCQTLNIARSGFYGCPKPDSDTDLWRSVKYKNVYLNAYESMPHEKQRLVNWIEFYHHERKHQTLKTTPNQMYVSPKSWKKQRNLGENNA